VAGIKQNRQEALRSFKELCETVGFPVEPFQMKIAGVNAKALSEFMGHATIAITYDLYGHLMPGSHDEAAGLLDAFLARELGGSAASQELEMDASRVTVGG
jgi:integrase